MEDGLQCNGASDRPNWRRASRDHWCWWQMERRKVPPLIGTNQDEAATFVRGSDNKAPRAALQACNGRDFSSKATLITRFYADGASLA